MRGGFTFCGVDIADVGLEYAPDGGDLYVFRPGSVKTHDESYDGHHGGYYYGATVKPKEFTLRCFFEQENIYKGLMTRVFNLFRRGKTGRLIFRERPWCYYVATVSDDVDTKEVQNRMGGIITIKMKAYYPFARSDQFVADDTDIYYEDMLFNSAMMEDSSLVPATEFTTFPAQTGAILSTILLNPGTERCPVKVSISGDVGDGVEIYNSTTGQRMKFVGVTHALTDEHSPAQVVECDSLMGKTVVRSTSAVSPGFLYHGEGFLELEPARAATRGIYVNYGMTSTITIDNYEGYEFTGQYIYLGGAWRKILAQPTNDTLTINYTPSAAGFVRTTIVPMNEIIVYANSTADLEELKFSYQPTYT